RRATETAAQPAAQPPRLGRRRPAGKTDRHAVARLSPDRGVDDRARAGLAGLALVWDPVQIDGRVRGIAVDGGNRRRPPRRGPDVVVVPRRLALSARARRRFPLPRSSPTGYSDGRSHPECPTGWLTVPSPKVACPGCSQSFTLPQAA